jgi:hypothetical protein
LSTEFLNFAEISKAVLFQNLLDELNIPYTKKNGELHGDGFIINIDKNLFFMPKNDSVKGSPINFLAYYKNIELRKAAAELKKQFLLKEKEPKPKRDMPNLTLEWDPYLQERGITPEIATQYEVGYVKQRSIVAGRIAFKIYDQDSKHSGYVGYRIEDGNWFFPKGFKRPLYNAHRLQDAKLVIVTVDPFDALRLVELGFKQVASLLANSMTAEQEEQLKKFKYILLFHNEPENIVKRLYSNSFVKAPVLSKHLKEMSDTELLNLINPAKLQN